MIPPGARPQLVLVALLAGLCCERATAQPAGSSNSKPGDSESRSDLRPMDTDRPNKANSPHTIDPGHVQIELGAFDWTYSKSRTGSPWQSQATFAQANFRVGVLDPLERNLVVNPLLYADCGGGSSTTGFGDLTVGGKLNFWGNASGDDPWATA